MPANISQTLTLVLANRDASTFDKAIGLIPNGEEVTILSDNKAVDIELKTGNYDNLQEDLSAQLVKHAIKADACVQPSKNRKKSLLICDMDSTLIGQECINELADFAGVKDHVSEITERAMRGEIGFDGALKERVNLLKDLPLSTLQKCFDERIYLNEGARTLCQTMKASGTKTVIVSGGFTFFTGRVAELCGFDDHQANILLDDGASLSGKVGMPILGR